MYISTRRCAGKYPFLPGQLSGHIFGVSSLDGQNLVDQIRVPQRRRVTNPNPLNVVGTGLTARQHAGFPGLDSDDLDFWVMAFQDSRHTSHRGPRPHRMHERVNLSFGLCPDFFSEWKVAGDGVVIVELIHPE